MAGKMSRNKGKRGEREVAKILQKHGFEGRRGVQYSGGPDSPDVTGLPNFHIEVKRTEQVRLNDWWKQVTDDCDKEEYPLIVHRKNRDNHWYAIMDFEDLLDYISCAEATTLL